MFHTWITRSIKEIEAELERMNFDGQSAAILFVSKYGNDETAVFNNQLKPWLSIQAALYAAKDGDCIYVYPGVYEEALLHPYGVNMYLCTGAVVSPIACPWLSSALMTEDPAIGDGDFFIAGHGVFEGVHVMNFPYLWSAIHLNNTSGNTQQVNLQFEKAYNIAGHGLRIEGYNFNVDCDQITGGYDQFSLWITNSAGTLNARLIEDHRNEAYSWNGSRTIYQGASNVNYNVERIHCKQNSDATILIFGASETHFNGTQFYSEKYSYNYKTFSLQEAAKIDFNHCVFNINKGLNLMLFYINVDRVRLNNCLFNIDTIEAGLSWLFVFQSMTQVARLELNSCRFKIDNLPVNMPLLFNLNNQMVELSINNTIIDAKGSTLVRMIQGLSANSKLSQVNSFLQMPNAMSEVYNGANGVINNVGSVICGAIGANIIVNGEVIRTIAQPIDL